MNDEQKYYLLHKVVSKFGDDLSGLTFTFWGVAFKANTDDVRETAAMTLAHKLIEKGATIQIFDPVASENYLEMMAQNKAIREKIKNFENKYDALNHSNGLITMTEWREFHAPDFNEIKSRLKTPVIFDGRNLYDSKTVLKMGLDYFAIGKKINK